MPRFALTPDEFGVVRTWLFEQNGYLDVAVRSSDGSTARSVLDGDRNVDLLAWINAEAQEDPAVSVETGMTWWILTNDAVNVPEGRIPVEKTDWRRILDAWDATIVAGLDKVSRQDRDSRSSMPIRDEDGTEVKMIGSGSQLELQREIVSKLLAIL